MKSIFKSVGKLKDEILAVKKKFLCASMALSLLLAGVSATSFAAPWSSSEDSSDSSDSSDYLGSRGYFYRRPCKPEKALSSSLCSDESTEETSSSSSYSDESTDDEDGLLRSEEYKLGGAYDDLCDARDAFVYANPDARGQYQVHHLLSKGALNRFCKYLREQRSREYEPWQTGFLYGMDQGWAPSIIMEKEDHERTRSYYNPSGLDDDNEAADDFISDQYFSLIEKGNFEGLLEEELRDIEGRFGDKYKQAIKEVREYIKDLNFRKRGSTIIFNNPDHPKRYFFYRPEDGSDYSQGNEPATKRAA